MSDFNEVKDTLAKENKVWIRISSSCNAHCIFCLDAQSHLGKFADEDMVKEKIKNSYDPSVRNRVILSGGEASINPKFPEYIAYAKEVGYDRVQTVTNGIMFANHEFTDKCVEAGLEEITFSMHGHTQKLHDLLVGVKGAFEKAFAGLLYVKKKHPSVIVNIDICVNKINYKYLADILSFYIRHGVKEFDVLQLTPFNKAVGENREHLVYDVYDAYPYLQKAWLLKNIPGVVMFTNRFPVEALENNEELIQNHNKIKGEIYDGNRKYTFKKALDEKKDVSCRGENCKYCFLEQFCDIFHGSYQKKLPKTVGKRSLLTGNDIDSLKVDQVYELQGFRFMEDLKDEWGQTDVEFKKKLADIEKKKLSTLNVPMCLNKYNQGYTSFMDYDGDRGDVGFFVEKYIEHLYRRKSVRCKKCKYAKDCEGIHISYIQAFGFKILEPVVD